MTKVEKEWTETEDKEEHFDPFPDLAPSTLSNTRMTVEWRSEHSNNWIITIKQLEYKWLPPCRYLPEKWHPHVHVLLR